MERKAFTAVALAFSAALFLAAPVLADKLICISDEKLKGQETVQSCVLRGEKFAIIDDHGVVRILTKEEMELMKKVNPQIFQMPAYGIMYQKEAPPLPKLPPLAVPKAHQ